VHSRRVPGNSRAFTHLALNDAVVEAESALTWLMFLRGSPREVRRAIRRTTCPGFRVLS
jgi:hypothetical protein